MANTTRPLTNIATDGKFTAEIERERNTRPGNPTGMVRATAVAANMTPVLANAASSNLNRIVGSSQVTQ